jgi:hypothetical protein
MQTLNSKQRVQGAKGVCLLQTPQSRPRSCYSISDPRSTHPLQVHPSVPHARRFASSGHRLLPQRHPRLHHQQQAQKSMACSGEERRVHRKECYAIGLACIILPPLPLFFCRLSYDVQNVSGSLCGCCSAPSSTVAIVPFPAFLVLTSAGVQGPYQDMEEDRQGQGQQGGLLLGVLDFKFNARLFHRCRSLSLAPPATSQTTSCSWCEAYLHTESGSGCSLPCGAAML